jgi:site-specific DNA-cytosine methylase
MNAQHKTFAEFFAGIGLMRIGLENAGWRIASANDSDHDKWEMYRNHFGDTAMIRGDTFRYGAVVRRVRNGKSMAQLRTDGIAGCFATEGRCHLN